MPFGKYRGRAVEDLPTHYLEWLLENIELRGRLADGVRREYERRLHDQRPERSLVDVRLVNEIVSAGVRNLARKYHPDLGGSHERMIAVNAAADWIREQAGCRQ